jgi:polar amino acid transport system substrate-binding protein
MSPNKSTWLAISALGVAGWAGAAPAASLAEIKSRGSLTVAVAADPPPFDAVADGKPAGFDAELLDKFRAISPVPLRVTVFPSGELLARLAAGEADLAASAIEITPQAQKRVGFTPPLAEATLAYLKRRDDETIRTIADLGGKRFGLRSGSGNFLQLTELEHVLAKSEAPLGEASTFESTAEAERALAAKSVDFVVGGIADLSAAAKAEPDAFAPAEPVGHRTYLAWAVAKGDQELAALLKDFVFRERDGGGLAQLQERWIGRSFAGLPDAVAAEDWWTARQDRPAELPIPKRTDPD